MAFGRRTAAPKKQFEDIFYEPPLGWEEKPLDDGGILFLQPDMYNYIFMEFLHDQEVGRSLEQAINDLIANHSQYKDHFLKLNSGITRTAKGVEHGFFTYNFSDEQGERLREVNIVIPVSLSTGKALFISLAAVEDEYAAVEHIFQKFVNDIEPVR